MTYQELLAETAEEKRKALQKINTALAGPYGTIIKAEMDANPGQVAWNLLAKKFCEKVAEHVDEFIEQAGGVHTMEAHEIGNIYMAYEDGDSDLYGLLPLEAQLFEA